VAEATGLQRVEVPPTWLERAWYSHEALPQALHAPLAAASWAFEKGARWNAALWDRGLRKPSRVAARVISVGNLTVGGAGKTPVVIHLAQELVALGARVAVLSRGYGGSGQELLVSDGRELKRSSREVGDEPVLVARRVPEAVVWVGPSRARLAARAVAETGAHVLLLDDGFQHRALHRDEDILVLGGAAPLGNGELLPLGPLREPITAATRASVAWLSNVPARMSLPPTFTSRRVQTRTVAESVVDWRLREPEPIESLYGVPVYLVAGLARPAGFVQTVQALGAIVVGYRLFRDHHAFTRDELQRIDHDALQSRATWVLTTEKDAVRMASGTKTILPVKAVRIGLQVVSGESVLREILLG
jgi:tetraacyldisaccharide 4'-kinase